jgi:hypothetical protein
MFSGDDEAPGVSFAYKLAGLLHSQLERRTDEQDDCIGFFSFLGIEEIPGEDDQHGQDQDAEGDGQPGMTSAVQ